MLGGIAVRKQVKFVCTRNTRQHEIDLLIYLPVDTKNPIPLFVGLNFYGNHTIANDHEISLPSSWVQNKSEWGISDNRASNASRGQRASRWPVKEIVERGFGLATIYYGDIDPDFDDGFRNGIHSLFDKEELDATRLTSISAWAWGLSRTLDYFETDDQIDASRVAVIGHSRLGKTALWAGATIPVSQLRFPIIQDVEARRLADVHLAKRWTGSTPYFPIGFAINSPSTTARKANALWINTCDWLGWHPGPST